MPAYNIKGFTVEIGGDTKNFNTALSELNGKISSSSREIGKIESSAEIRPHKYGSACTKARIVKQGNCRKAKIN